MAAAAASGLLLLMAPAGVLLLHLPVLHGCCWPYLLGILRALLSVRVAAGWLLLLLLLLPLLLLLLLLLLFLLLPVLLLLPPLLLLLLLLLLPVRLHSAACQGCCWQDT